MPDEWPTQRPHRIGIGGYDLVGTGDGPGPVEGDEKVTLERSWFVETDIDGAATTVEDVIGKKRPALLLVNDEDLAYAKIRLDEVSLATAIQHVDLFTASLPRSMVLAAAWDMTRDAEMAPRAFVDLVLGNIAAETPSTVALMLLRQLATTIALYVDPAVAGDACRAAADRLWELAQAADAGSDNQYQFVKAFAGFAETDTQLDAVQALLDEKTRLEGLAIDTDLGWDLLISLAAGGRADATEIDAMLAKDATASGERRAAHARAAIPTAAAKRAAWDALINAPEGGDLPTRSWSRPPRASTTSTTRRLWSPTWTSTSPCSAASTTQDQRDGDQPDRGPLPRRARGPRRGPSGTAPTPGSPPTRTPTRRSAASSSRATTGCSARSRRRRRTLRARRRTERRRVRRAPLLQPPRLREALQTPAGQVDREAHGRAHRHHRYLRSPSDNGAKISTPPPTTSRLRAP